MNNIVCFASEISVSTQKKRVIIEELLKGQEAATQLKVLLLEKPFWSEAFLSFQEVMDNVLRSFSEALSILNSSSSSEPAGSAAEVAHRSLLNSGQNGSPVAASGEKRFQKDGRGRYNRRKSAVSWTILSCTIDDNHVWRKYGQKRVLNTEFPRSYFRCGYKYDQGCKANKQVQRDQENPNMYRITYIGIHTCNATPKATHSATDSNTWESFLLNSDGEIMSDYVLTLNVWIWILGCHLFILALIFPLTKRRTAYQYNQVGWPCIKASCQFTTQAGLIEFNISSMVSLGIEEKSLKRSIRGFVPILHEGSNDLLILSFFYVSVACWLLWVLLIWSVC